MFADEQGGRLGHRRLIEGVVAPARASGEEWMPHGRHMQKVSVSTSLRAKPCVKVAVHLDDVPDRNPWRQVRIHAADPCGLRALGVGIEMHHLPKRVHTCVGSPGADGGDSMARDRCERPLELILDGAPGGLGLPSLKATPVVGKHQREAPHAGLQTNRNRSSAQSG